MPQPSASVPVAMASATSPFEAPPDTPSEATVMLASLLVPGLGQILCGQVLKGGLILVGSMFLCCGLGVFNLIAAADAYRVAQRIKAGEIVGPWQTF